MKKKTKTPRTKISADTIAKGMKKQLGEFHAQRVAREIVNSNKNVMSADVNMKDIFEFEDLKRNQRIWEQVHHILSKHVK